MTDDPLPPLNRRQRRQADRLATARLAAAGGLRPMPPRGLVPCTPGKHAYSEVVGTVAGKPAARMVVCLRCHLTFQQIMEQSPGDLMLYKLFLAEERGKVAHSHEPDPDGLPVDDCPGCARLAELEHSSPENLG